MSIDLSRRELFLSALGFPALAAAAVDEQARQAAKKPHFPATAKNVIFLFMHGGPSHIETFDPKLSEHMTRIIEFWEKKVRESPATEGTGRAVRGAHAKTLGVVRAEVEMTGNAPAPYAQGIYATPGRHDALIRFSSASNHLGPDAALGPVLGFAIKIFDVGGTKLVEDEPDSATRSTSC